MTTAEQPSSRTTEGGAPTRRRTSTGTWLTAVRTGSAPDRGEQDRGVPTDAVDEAVRRRAAGGGSAQAVLEALVSGTLYLPADAAGRIAACAGGRMGYVPVFTDPSQAPDSSPRLIPVSAFWLLAALPHTTTLWINPESDAPHCLFLEDLRDVAGKRAGVPAGIVPPGVPEDEEPAAAVPGERHSDGTDSALRSAYGRFRRRFTLPGEPHHGHALDGPADHGAASRPLPLPGP